MRIGLDLTDLDRIQKAVEQPRFSKRIFSPEEQELFASRAGRRKIETMAGNFCAKEAFVKALGCGFDRGITPDQIGVLRDPAGAPFLKLTGKAAQEARGWSISVSITHTETTAAAVVLMEETAPLRKL